MNTSIASPTPDRFVEPLERFVVGDLRVEVYDYRKDAGAAAGRAVAAEIERRLFSQTCVRIVFAAAPSQSDLYESLASQRVRWTQVHAFHMDEYIGLDNEAQQCFGNYLTRHLYSKVRPGRVELLHPRPDNVDRECERYESLLREAPIDISCLGIGENGHIAFNDPPGVLFDDPRWVKPVVVALRSRQQQLNDGCFETLEEVPKEALTVTIPPLVSAGFITVVVPGSQKAEAIRASLIGPMTPDCPASILRTCPQAVLYLDRDSAAMLHA